MKHLPFIAALLILSCSDSTKEEPGANQITSEINAHDTLKGPLFNFIENETVRKYGNTKYRLLTRGKINKDSTEFTGIMHLMHRSDTILSKYVTTDSIALKVRYRQEKYGHYDTINFEGYKLTDMVITPGIRGYNAFYIGKFQKPDKRPLYVRFGIKLMSGPKGKIWVNHIGYDPSYYITNKAIVMENYTRKMF
jgi:hypothetical protein